MGRAIWQKEQSVEASGQACADSGTIVGWGGDGAQEPRDKSSVDGPGTELPALASRPLGLRQLPSPLTALHHRILICMSSSAPFQRGP